MSDGHPGPRFRALHHPGRCFVIPNPWDAGTARILAGLGFEALATTSAGLAFSLGVKEGSITLDQVLAHCRDLVACVPVPVSADLENGYGDAPETVAKTVRAAAETGLAGCSIEDYSGNPEAPIYDFGLAVERIAAAVEAARSLDDDFVLTARAENFLWNRTDLDDTIRRLQSFENAGADVVYAPGLGDLQTIAEVCQSVNIPVNVVMGLPGATFGVAELREAGVTRISVGSALARAAFGTFVRAAREIAEQGSFTFADQAIGFRELEDLL